MITKSTAVTIYTKRGNWKVSGVYPRLTIAPENGSYIFGIRPSQITVNSKTELANLRDLLNMVLKELDTL